MKKKYLIAAAISSIVGAVIAAVSTIQHMRLLREGFENASFCAVSERINCDVVNGSTYSEIWGIPIAWLGLIFYLLIVAFSVTSVLRKKDSRATIVISLIASISAILFSAYFAYISFFILEVICFECVSMYIINIMLLLFIYLALGVPLGGIMRFFKDYISALLRRPSNLGFKPQVLRHTAVALAFFFVGWIAIAQLEASEKVIAGASTVDDKVKAFYMQSEHSLEIDPSWTVWGNPDAKVTIVEFSEFQCPFCKVAAFNVKPFLQEFKKDIRFFFVNYPLDNACNENMAGPMHESACMAAKGGLCANKLGDFWGYHDFIFKNQRKLSQELVSSFVKEKGWNEDDFTACMNSPEVDGMVKSQIKSGEKIHVDGTPSIYLNSRKVKYWRDSKFLQAVVREEIEKSRKP